MIGERAFDLLKSRRMPPETAKQAEIGLAWMATILSICRQAAGSAEFPPVCETPVRVELPLISAGYG
jgi:hypothetical protein